jgi:hypothetical protein
MGVGGATVTTGAVAGTVVATTSSVIAGGLAVGSVAAGIAGTAFGMYSSHQQGKAMQAQHNYQAHIARNNALIAERNAAEERQAGLEDSRRIRLNTIALMGQQQVAMAANGIDISQGTPLDLLADTATKGELDAQMSVYQAERRALNFETQAGNFTNQSNLDILAGQNARRAGTMNAVATGINGLGNALSSAVGFGLGGSKRVANSWSL